MFIILSDFACVLAPWLVLAVVAPVLLYALRALFAVMGSISGARDRARVRRSFSRYMQRGFY